MSKYADYGRSVIALEKDTLEALTGLIEGSFDQAIEAIRKNASRVCVTGMGKAGIIGQKIAATLASTGTQSFYLHPADASHGDLGMIGENDIILALSNSGESHEISAVIPALKSIGAGIIAITGNPESTLGREADIVLNIGTIKEACPLGLAPTSSTTAMLAMGDALALTLLKYNEDFDQNSYAFYHPGGSLGKKLLRVHEVMRTGEECPAMPAGSLIKDVLFTITKARAGGAAIVDAENKILGFFADGDLRRGIEKHDNILDLTVDDFMTKNPKTIESGAFALEALALLKKYMIGEVPVVNEDNQLAGMIALKDLISIGLLE